MENKLERKYGLFTAICMVAGIVIGSGVFFKAQTILQKTEGNMPLGILAWIIGGAIMIICILAFSAMSACIVSRAASSEATGRVVLCDKTGLLVCHLLCCFHIIPLEYIPHSVTHYVARVTA